MIYDDFESVPGNDYIWWLIPVRMARVWGTVDLKPQFDILACGDEMYHRTYLGCTFLYVDVRRYAQL